MILYVNGDSHTAAAEAVNPHAFAEDDGQYFYMGRAPHPDNLSVSWGRVAADLLKATFKCDAESAASNQRIMRTARAWLDACTRPVSELLVIIQWSTWERQEWLIDGVYYQINASGIDAVPKSHEQQYKEFVTMVDWNQVRVRAHDDIWRFHKELDKKKIRHVFFNGNNHFADIPEKSRKRWGKSYIDPYDAKMTYNQWLLDNGHQTVAPNSWHFGPRAHAAWARFVLQYCIKNQLV